MNLETLYCPNRNCKYYGKPWHKSLLVKNGTTRGQPQARCNACRQSIALSYATAYFDLKDDPMLFEITFRQK